MDLRKERAIVSETQLDSVVPGATESDAETGEADDVSEYSDEAGGLDPAGEAEDAPSADGSAADDDGDPADAPGSFAHEGAASAGYAETDEADAVADEADDAEPVDSAREEFERELRMQPGDWYVVHSYA